MTAFLVDYTGDEELGLLAPCKLVLVETTEELRDVGGLDGYQTAYTVYLDRSVPVGMSVLPVHGGVCRAGDLAQGLQRHREAIDRLALRRRLVPTDDGHPSTGGEAVASIVIPTRDRPHELAGCLAAIVPQMTPDCQLIVVDSAPRNGGVASLVKAYCPGADYLLMEEPGASPARNAGAALARHDLIVFLDDDTRPLPGCLAGLLAAFRLHPAVDLVTGLVLPDDMESTAQARFEAAAGFGRGVTRRWFTASAIDPHGESLPQQLRSMGVGACCAVRRSAFDAVDGFCTGLGPGDRYVSGEDVDLFVRILLAGGIQIYEPAAMSRHHHRDDMEAVESQLIGSASGIARTLRRMASATSGVSRMARRAARQQLGKAVGEAIGASWRPREFAASVYWRRCWEFFANYHLPGLPAGSAARFAPDRPEVPADAESAPQAGEASDGALEVLRVDLDRGVQSYPSLDRFEGVECHVFTGMRFRGRLRLPAVAGTVTRNQVVDAMACSLPADGLDALRPGHAMSATVLAGGEGEDRGLWRAARFRPSVSVVIPTRDRPQDLAVCLAAMARQDYDGPLEVLVVDNNPGSGRTREVVERFGFCRYLAEPRPGAATARNSGFRESGGDIIAITDDDVRVPPTWIRQLVEPFFREDIWMVTGSILPRSLEREAERRFEEYGGFAFFDRAVEAGPRWFRGTGGIAPPVWQLGASANMAFRRRLLDDPAIGPMKEHLGPGTPAGAGEDIHFVYRLLKEGHTVRFDPTIWVYHCHRRTMAGFRRQIMNYGRSAVAHHLEIALSDKDFRGLRMVFRDLPVDQLYRLAGRRHRTPGAMGPELLGQTTGLFSYFVSRWRRRLDPPGGNAPGAGAR